MRVLAALALVASVLVADAPGVHPSQIRPLGAGGEWTPRFSDDFDGDALDPKKWSSGFGWGEVSRRTYGYCAPANNIVGGGVLEQRIERKRRGGRPFTVGCVNSRERFSQLYGFWEARMRVAGCRGARSSFWAKPADESWPPEIDMVEVYGDRRAAAELTVHWEENGRHRQSKGIYEKGDFSEAFHVIGMRWTPYQTIWYVDGVERRRTGAGYRFLNDGGPFYMMLEAQVVRDDSRCGIWPSYSSAYVDYVRVWKRRR
ncbi:MAG: glycoside hydrolase family 16 protein [Acidimicrobiia bacterium]